MAEGNTSKPRAAAAEPQRPTSKTSLLPPLAAQQRQDPASFESTKFSYTPFTGKFIDDVRTGTPKLLRMMSAPITGEEHKGGLWVGLITFILVGCVIGDLLPKNEMLPTPWYRTVSACIGYSYFVCWAVSFYPQALTNWRRQTTVGLSADFCALNVLGFACYAAYNVAFFFSSSIQDQYRMRHGANSEITVQSNDVAFAVHALVLSSITLSQIGYYDGFHDQISKEVATILVILLVVIVLAFFMVFVRIELLDFFYVLSYIKILITLLKYMPQIILNFRRKSTHGFSIWQILLDFSGGILSIAQLVLDCLDLHDWSGLTGNLAKFLLGAISVVLDSIIMLQHYIWFPDEREEGAKERANAVDDRPTLRKQTSLPAGHTGQHADDSGVPYHLSAIV